jgi:hypothetical protein
MRWVNPAEEEDARLLWIRYAVGKGKANRSSVWRRCDQRVTRHINIAVSQLFHDVINGVTDRIPYMRRICIDKLYKRCRVNFWLHWAECGPCWEHRSNLF